MHENVALCGNGLRWSPFELIFFFIIWPVSIEVLAGTFSNIHWQARLASFTQLSKWNENFQPLGKTQCLAWPFSEKTKGIAIALAGLLSLLAACKILTFCNISVIIEDIYLKLWLCVHYSKTIHTIKGNNSKCRFFQKNAPFSTWTFLSCIKHPTAECWHLHAVLLLLLQSYFGERG